VGEESHEKQSTCPSYTKCFYKMFLAESAEVCKELTAYHQCDMTASSSGVSHHGSTFLDEDEECTKRFLAAALAPTTNTFAGTSTKERLQMKSSSFGKNRDRDIFPTICTTKPALCSSSAPDCKRKQRS
jgi:hypothetical protein